jgi:rhodanese-related sulfurtransferase
MKTNKKENVILLIGLVLIILVALVTFLRNSKNQPTNNESGVTQKVAIPNYPTISAKDLSAKIKNKEKVAIIDVRSEDDYQTDHAIDSINLPLDQLAVTDPKIDADSVIVVSGNGPEESNKGADILSKKGFQKVFVLAGGLAAWKNISGQSLSWGDPTSFANQSKVTFINPEDAKKYIDEKKPAYFLDVRDSSLFHPHISGAVNIPLIELEKKRNEIPLEKDIIVYGSTEFESFQAGVQLFDLGILSAQVLRGGMIQWKDKNFPVEQ